MIYGRIRSPADIIVTRFRPSSSILVTHTNTSPPHQQIFQTYLARIFAHQTIFPVVINNLKKLSEISEIVADQDNIGPGCVL